MADTNSTEPSWKRFANFEGPDEDTRTRALRAKREREGHGGNEYDSLQGGNTTHYRTSRDWKHNRKIRV